MPREYLFFGVRLFISAGFHYLFLFAAKKKKPVEDEGKLSSVCVILSAQKKLNNHNFAEFR